MNEINLNFLVFENQDFGITVYRRKAEEASFFEQFDYYDFEAVQ